MRGKGWAAPTASRRSRCYRTGHLVQSAERAVVSRRVVALLVGGSLLFGVVLTALAVPKPPPPRVKGPVQNAPPPAWIETKGGDRWLAFSNYCWRTTCLDFIAPALRPEVPRIRVCRGETVRFHLGFGVRKLAVRVGTRTFPLAPSRVASWRVQGAGIAVLEAISTGNFGVDYVARLVLD